MFGRFHVPNARVATHRARARARVKSTATSKGRAQGSEPALSPWSTVGSRLTIL